MYVLNIAINLGYGYYQFGPHWVYWAPYWLLPIRSWRIRSKKIQKSMQNTQHLHWFNTNVHCSSTFQDLCGRWEYKTYNVKKSSTKLSLNHIEMEKLIQFLRETRIFISWNLKCWWHQYLDKVWNFVHWCTYWGRKTWKITMSTRKIEKCSMIPQPRKMKADPCLSFFTGLTICTNDQFDNRYEFNTPMTNRLSRCLFRNFELHPCLIQQIISNRQEI